MNEAIITLFVCGLAAGGCSVVLCFLRRASAGAYPQRTFQKSKTSKSKKKKQGRMTNCSLDFLFCFFVGTYLVLYDATVLGGTGRFYHLAVFFFGFALVRYLLLSVLFRPVEWTFRLLLDLWRAAVWSLTFPLKKCFSFFFGFLYGAYLIMKRKNDKMKAKRKAKREIARLLSGSETAFLSSGATEAVFSGEG